MTRIFFCPDRAMVFFCVGKANPRYHGSMIHEELSGRIIDAAMEVHSGNWPSCDPVLSCRALRLRSGQAPSRHLSILNVDPCRVITISESMSSPIGIIRFIRRCLNVPRSESVSHIRESMARHRWPARNASQGRTKGGIGFNDERGILIEAGFAPRNLLWIDAKGVLKNSVRDGQGLAALEQ